jgi:hypothetical protein
MKKKPAAPEPASDLQGKIREAEFKNILQKLKDWKVLTAREAMERRWADAAGKEPQRRA